MSFHRKVFCGSRTPYTCHYMCIYPHRPQTLECVAPGSVSCARKIPERLAADHPLESETVRADHQEQVVKKFCLGN